MMLLDLLWHMRGRLGLPGSMDLYIIAASIEGIGDGRMLMHSDERNDLCMLKISAMFDFLLALYSHFGVQCAQ